jgi:hypothetical protein
MTSPSPLRTASGSHPFPFVGWYSASSYCTRNRRGIRGTNPNLAARARLMNTHFTAWQLVISTTSMRRIPVDGFNAPCTALTPSDHWCSRTNR